MSQGGANGTSTGGGGGGGITTIQGDSGSITGSTVTIYANNAANAAGSSVIFTNSGTVSTLSVTDINLSTFIGNLAGNATISGVENTGIGNTALASLTSGTLNTSLGSRSGSAIQDGVSNVAVGVAAMNANVSGSNNVSVGEESMLLNTGDQNTALGAKAMGGGSGNCHDNVYSGYAAGNANTTGSQNVGLGSFALTNLLDGINNVCIGYQAGLNLTSNETNNVYLGNQQLGITGESNVMRLGATQTECFIAGILGNTTGSPTMTTIDSVTGQMGSQAIPGGGGGFAPQFQSNAVVAGNQTAVTVPFICANPPGAMSGTVNIQNSSMYLIPIYIDENKTFTAMGCLVTNVPGIGSTIDFVLYDNTAAGGLPGNLITSAINVPSEITSITEGVISQTLNVGWYWIGIQRNIVATVTLRGYSNGDAFSMMSNKLFFNPSQPTTTNFSMFAYFAATNTYGIYPNSPTITQNEPTNIIPLLYIR